MLWAGVQTLPQAIHLENTRYSPWVGIIEDNVFSEDSMEQEIQEAVTIPWLQTIFNETWTPIPVGCVVSEYLDTETDLSFDF